jgi:hypothetical protein
MNIPELKIKRSSLLITYRCTLKCKLCASYSPYYDVPPHFSSDLIAKTLASYFSIVDHVKQFSISGGEPFLHNELPKIIKNLLCYQNQFDVLEVITNGTLMPKDELLAALNQSPKTCVMIDDYGDSLSKKAEMTHKILADNGIRNSVRCYYGANAHCGGWVDFGENFERRWSSGGEIAMVYNKCAYPAKLGFCFQISGNELHPCSRSRRCMETGVLSKDKTEYIDLLDDAIPIDDKKSFFLNFASRKFLRACAYCSGFCEDSPRFAPAEQLEG